jgi:hypothetical protein
MNFREVTSPADWKGTEHFPLPDQEAPYILD